MDRFVQGPIIFHGKVYRGLDTMPYEARQAYLRALRALSEAIPTGAPDTWEEWGPGDGSSPGPSTQLPVDEDAR